MKRKKIIKESNIASPSYLPQLNQPYSEVVNGLEDEGVTCTPVMMRVGQLQPAQNDINITKMKDFSSKYNDGEYNLDPIFVSGEDNYILDGHHRAAGLIHKEGKDAKIKTIKLNTNKDKGIRELNKVQDIYEYKLKESKKEKPKKNIIKLSKNDLNEYARKVIEQNLEEYDLEEETTNEPKQVRDFSEELESYNDLQGLKVYDTEYGVYGFINDDDIEDGFIPSLIFLTKEKDSTKGKYHHTDHLEVIDKNIKEDKLGEGPRTHSDMRTQKLKSQPEKKYAKSRLRHDQRLEEEKNEKYKATKDFTITKEEGGVDLTNPGAGYSSQFFDIPVKTGEIVTHIGTAPKTYFPILKKEDGQIGELWAGGWGSLPDYLVKQSNISEDDITEEHINRYRELKEKYGVHGYPSEELDLNKQEQFMSEYATPHVPIAGEVASLEEQKKKLRINRLDTYRDGGTIKVVTDEGIFYIDRRMDGSSNPSGLVYDDYPSRGNLIPNGNEIKRRIYDALEGYEDGIYKENHIESIRRFISEYDTPHVPIAGEVASLEEQKKKAKDKFEINSRQDLIDYAISNEISDYHEIGFDHVIQMMESIYSTKFNQLDGGGFVCSVVDASEGRETRENVYRRGDSVNQKYVDFYIQFAKDLEKIENPKDYYEIFGFSSSSAEDINES